MTTFTIELPDEIAGRVAPVKQQLPHLLLYALNLIGLHDEGTTVPQHTYPVLVEAVEFLSSAPTSARIVAFKFSPVVQSRLENLLRLRDERDLTPLERSELDCYQQMNHLLVLLKARARPAAVYGIRTTNRRCRSF